MESSAYRFPNHPLHVYATSLLSPPAPLLPPRRLKGKTTHRPQPGSPKLGGAAAKALKDAQAAAQEAAEAVEVEIGARLINNTLDVILVHPTLHTSTLMNLSRMIRLTLMARGIVYSETS